MLRLHFSALRFLETITPTPLIVGRRLCIFTHTNDFYMIIPPMYDCFSFMSESAVENRYSCFTNDKGHNCIFFGNHNTITFNASKLKAGMEPRPKTTI